MYRGDTYGQLLLCGGSIPSISVWCKGVVYPALVSLNVLARELNFMYMKRIDNDNTLDWYNTRGGRTIVKPVFGDRLSFNDWFKKPAKEKIIPKTKPTLLEKLRRNGYVRTYIECDRGIVCLNRVVVFRECSRIFQGVKSVYYSTEKEKYSKIYYK